MPVERFEWPSEHHEPVADLVCSARGCRARATWALRWNNPRLHTPERRKTWLACEVHRAPLSQHLGARAFLRETDPVGAGPVADGADAPAPPAPAPPAPAADPRHAPHPAEKAARADPLLADDHPAALARG